VQELITERKESSDFFYYFSRVTQFGVVVGMLSLYGYMLSLRKKYYRDLDKSKKN